MNTDLQKLRIDSPKQTQPATQPPQDATECATNNATIRLKALANAVLERNRERNRSATTFKKDRNSNASKDPQKLRQVAQKLLTGFRANDHIPEGVITNLNTVCQTFGIDPAQALTIVKEASEDDWEEVQSDPDLMFSMAHAVLTRRMRESGEIPPNYTAITECEHCGPVPVYPGFPEKAASCPWCLNRMRGDPIPRLQKVICDECKNFISDNINSTGGMGICRVRTPQASETLLYPWSKRICNLWLPIKNHYLITANNENNGEINGLNTNKTN